ncbi:ABC transporter ATP-binding protein [Salipaludibacillus sp. HK11]|uniref:ABC transporter ATP-binding protein n=1 Tax=Salipaludibacillus sp. HK11 TaxID=3394320 RepID=UPI0039FD96E8
MEKIVRVQHFEKTFGKEKAIKDVHFEVEKGEIFGLLGPSGSGKTTTIKVLTGELSAPSGEISVLNYTPKQFRDSNFKKQLGILSDNSALYERLTVEDNLKLFCKLYEVPINRVDEVLTNVKLLDSKKKVVSKLSKGMKQRILLAKAIMHKPRLMFLDEPTSALDPLSVTQIHGVLRDLRDEGITIFLTTHNMEEATVLCDRVAFLHEGVIKEIGKPDELRYKYSTGDFHIKTIDGERMVIGNKPESADEISRLIKSKRIKRMETHYPTLGDVFVDITGKELM